MTVVKVLLLVLILLIAPAATGYLFKREGDSPYICIVYGYLFQWACMAVFAIPFIILNKQFSVPVLIFAVSVAVFSGVGAMLAVRKRDWLKRDYHRLEKSEFLYLGLFLGLVLFQLYKAVFFSYEDGDDAYYISIAQYADTSDIMYTVDPYTGALAGRNFRYALAPFPMWVAAVARLSGVDVAIVSHLVLPFFLIPLTYIVYYEISGCLFKEDREKRYMLLSLAAVFEMFSNVSTSTAGTFLLTRSRQGKAALANLILPFLFLWIFRVVEAECKIRFKDAAILFVTFLAAALASVLGNILVLIMIFALLLYMLIKKKGFVQILVIALCAIPNVIVTLLYVILE